MIKLYEEPGNGFVGVHFDEDLQLWIMHIECKEWSVSTYKRYKKLTEDTILPLLKQLGIEEVYGFSETEKEVHFNRMFGAETLPYIVTTDDGIQHYLVKRSL